MITHKIWHGSKSESVVIPQATSHVPWGAHGPVPKARNQDELTAVINQIGAKVGDFYVYTGTNVHSLACIHCVVNIETDYTKVQKRFALDEVIPFYLLQVDKWSPSAYRWLRWENLVHLRPINDKEYDNFIRGKIDYIQDYCQPHFPKGFKLQER